MSDDYQHIEVITGTARRRRWSTAEKLRIVEEISLCREAFDTAIRRFHNNALIASAHFQKK